MKDLAFWDRFFSVFKWAHCVAFIWFAMLLVSIIDTVTLGEFVKFLIVILYSAAAGVGFMSLQEYVRHEIIKAEKVEKQEILYHAIRDSFIDKQA